MSTNGHENGYLANNAGGFVTGLLMGGLIGAGSMLLLAPQSGKKTRAQIQKEGLELRDQVVETVEDTVAQARGQARRVTARVHKQTKRTTATRPGYTRRAKRSGVCRGRG